MSWLQKLLPKLSSTSKRGVPEGVWDKCSSCTAILYRAELERNLNVCPKCGFHNRLTGRARLERFLDEQDREEIGAEVEAVDMLKFRDSKRYKDRLSAAQKATGEKEALVVMQGAINKLPVVVASFDFNFIGGSMSAGVGKRFVLGAERALEARLPYICFSTSGGARMQEGVISLFQMARTSAALARLAQAKVPFVSVLTDPTMGGVSASLAMLGDIIIAEPNALIGFSGPRVIEQTIREKLPEGFQRSEFLLEHGAVDMIVDRRELKQELEKLLRILLKV